MVYPNDHRGFVARIFAGLLRTQQREIVDVEYVDVTDLVDEEQGEEAYCCTHMNVLKQYSEIVYVRHALRKEDVKPGTLYLNMQSHTVTSQCPCGCGCVGSVLFEERPIDDAWNLKDKSAMERNEDGEISFSSAFIFPDCPIGLLFFVRDNNIKVIGWHDKNN